MKRTLKKLLAFFPSPLPFGAAEFEAWASDIIFIYELPDNDSMRWSLATMIQHCDATASTKCKRYFGRVARKGGANQVAGWIMQQLKVKQQEEQRARDEAEKLAKEVEAANGQDKPEAQG